MATAVVTGCSTGIGLATAVTLGRAGHRVFATMRRPAPIAEAKGLPITVVAMDVDSDDSVHTAMKEIGAVDVLVNNAGIGLMGSVEEMPLSDFRKVMETNFFGALRCIQAVLPAMRTRGSGCIVNVTSVAGRLAGGAQGAYSASKWALEALSESLACEVKALGIRVAIVEPGVIATPIFGKTGGDPASVYPHKRRLDAFFRASLQNPVSPYVVGEAILAIVNGKSDTLRYPVGPDAVPLLESRRHVTDEAWVASQAVSDEEWSKRMSEAFGIDVKM